MKAVIYSRVSTVEQDNERQIQELKEYASYKKMKVLKIFEEKVSGATKGADRLEFKAMLSFIDKNNIDTILVWELSRLGRRMVDVMNTIESFSDRGVNIYIKKENINTLDANHFFEMSFVKFSSATPFLKMAKSSPVTLLFLCSITELR